MEEVQIRFVEDHNLPGPQARTHFARPQIIVFAGSVHQGELRQKGLEVEAHMTFGGRLAPPMFGPGQTAGDESNGSRVHNMNHPFEPEGKTGTVPGSKVGGQRLQVREQLPVAYWYQSEPHAPFPALLPLEQRGHLK